MNRSKRPAMNSSPAVSRNHRPSVALLAAVCCLSLTALGADGPGRMRFGARRLQPEPIAPGRFADDPAGLKPIGAIEPLIFTPRGELPPDAAAARFAAAGVVRQPMGTHRDWPMQLFAWQAPDMCHRPLYFEEVNLERYGHSFGLAQPFVSAAHFFGRVPMLPYLAGAYPPHECIYPLGHYRPGSCAPYQIHFPPPSARGAAYQAGAVTGLIYLIP